MWDEKVPSMPATFRRPGGGRFQIGRAAIDVIGHYVQDDNQKPEAGGVLLGRHIRDSEDIIVDRVTTPMKGDYGNRTHFYRHHVRHQDVIDHAWQESGGTCTYLGEWHTHPELRPLPSWVDHITWRRKLMFDRFSGCLYFVIVGVEGLNVWEGHRHSPFLYPLSIIA